MSNASVWYVKNLGDASLAGEALADIEALAGQELARQGGPPQLAVLVRHESEWGLHCEAKVYFSPAASAVAAAVAAGQCARPARSGLSLLVGTEQAWEVLFPASDANPDQRE